MEGFSVHGERRICKQHAAAIQHFSAAIPRKQWAAAAAFRQQDGPRTAAFRQQEQDGPHTAAIRQKEARQPFALPLRGSCAQQ